MGDGDGRYYLIPMATVGLGNVQALVVTPDRRQQDQRLQSFIRIGQASSSTNTMEMEERQRWEAEMASYAKSDVRII
jgi:hypothetical protein